MPRPRLSTRHVRSRRGAVLPFPHADSGLRRVCLRSTATTGSSRPAGTGWRFCDGRPGVFCLPPRRPADALTAGPYALCAEYRAGRIEAREYSTALAGYGEMLVAMAALDTLDDPSPATISARAEVVERLRENATLRTLCAAPSLRAVRHTRRVRLACTRPASPSG